MRSLRILVPIIVLIALPGTCLTEPLPPRDQTSPLVMRALQFPAEDRREIAPGLSLEAGWRLSSENDHFDGYSALVPLPDGRLLAGSDMGRLLYFNPEATGGEEARFSGLSERRRAGKKFSDLEALYVERASGTFWAAFERRNAILRFDEGERLTGWVTPKAMRGWSGNGGPEAMTRLADGRFLVIAESPRRLFGNHNEALLFEGDPVENSQATKFLLEMPKGNRPVEVAQLPDGSLAILLRKTRLSLSPGFDSAILFGRLEFPDGKPKWRTNRTIRLGAPIPPENYEGMAVRPLPHGSAELWLISDNNRSVFQHTYLIKLRWSPNEKTRGKPARVSEKSNGSKAADN